ncbi:MAG: hypothetical protein R3E39_16610 [Anaerolineae bacterium]
MKYIARFLVVGLLLAALIAPVSAHEGREVGETLIEFGWRLEPAYTNLLNGPELTIETHDDGKPVEGLEETLLIEVSYGGKSKALRLRAVANEPGHYTADLIPTQPGDYSFHLTGKIGDVDVDEVFDSASGEFSSVDPISDIQFP